MNTLSESPKRRTMRGCRGHRRLEMSGSSSAGKIYSTRPLLGPPVMPPTTTPHTMALQRKYHSTARALIIIPRLIRQFPPRVPLGSFDPPLYQPPTSLNMRKGLSIVRTIPFTGNQQSEANGIPRAITLLMTCKRPVSCATL